MSRQGLHRHAGPVLVHPCDQAVDEATWRDRLAEGRDVEVEIADVAAGFQYDEYDDMNGRPPSHRR